MDFVRFLHAPMLSTLGGLILVFVAAHFVLKCVDEEMRPVVRKGRNWLAAIMLVALIWFAISAASVNETSRKVIDRSVANDRADILEQQAKEAKETAAREAAEQKKGESK